MIEIQNHIKGDDVISLREIDIDNFAVFVCTNKSTKRRMLRVCMNNATYFKIGKMLYGSYEGQAIYAKVIFDASLENSLRIVFSKTKGDNYVFVGQKGKHSCFETRLQESLDTQRYSWVFRKILGTGVEQRAYYSPSDNCFFVGSNLYQHKDWVCISEYKNEEDSILTKAGKGVFKKLSADKQDEIICLMNELIEKLS